MERLNLDKDNQNSSDIEPSDVLGMYLQAIRSRTLLSITEEQKLGYVIRAGATFIKCGAEGDERFVPVNKIDSESEEDWWAKVGAAQEAWEILVDANYLLVVAIAKKYDGRGVELLELIQQGNLGLLKVAGRYNPDFGYKFSTYAVWWIRNQILKKMFEQDPNIEELDRPIGRKGSDISLGDTIPDNSKSVEEQVEFRCDVQPVFDNLSELLSPVQLKLIHLRFVRRMTLGEIGQELYEDHTVTREAVRQMEVKILQILRKSIDRGSKKKREN